MRAPGGGNGDSPHYEFVVRGDAIRLNVMPSDEVKGHLRAFARWASSQADASERKTDAIMLIEHTRTVLDLVTDAEYESNQELWPWLFDCARRNDGFLFILDSLYLANGAVLLGSARDVDSD